MDRPCRVLLVEHGVDGHDTGLSIPVLRCLTSAGGYEVSCLTAAPGHSLRHSPHVECHTAAWDSPRGVVGLIRDVNARTPIDLVLPIDEPDIANVTAIAGELRRFTTPVLLPTDRQVCRADDKWTSYEDLVAAGVPTPRTVLPGGDRTGTAHTLAGWGCDRYLLKPAIGFGGLGIEIHDSPAAVLDAWEAATAAAATGCRYLIQEFVDGADRDVSFLSHGGEVIAATVQEPARCQAVEYRSALGLRFVVDPEALDIVRRFAATTRWDGVAHIDMRVDAGTGRLSVIEINPRYWQTLLGSLAMGINFADLHCRLSLGEAVERPGPARTGVWMNAHSLSADLTNLRMLRRSDVRPMLASYRHGLAADPRLELYLAGRTIKKFVRYKFDAHRPHDP